MTDGQYVTVPQVSAMAAPTARAELQNLGFTVRTGQSQHNNVVAKGDVIKTDPAVGASAKRGAVVTMVVSTGPVMITVPQVTGLTQAAAQSALRKAGLTPGQVTSAASSTIGAGVVISTNPVVGTPWPQDKPVGLTVSAGPPLPNFVGQQFQAAQGQAQSGGYRAAGAGQHQQQPAGRDHHGPVAGRGHADLAGRGGHGPGLERAAQCRHSQRGGRDCSRMPPRPFKQRVSRSRAQAWAVWSAPPRPARRPRAA